MNLFLVEYGNACKRSRRPDGYNYPTQHKSVSKKKINKQNKIDDLVSLSDDASSDESIAIKTDGNISDISPSGISNDSPSSSSGKD